jgi:hypothetical protein
VVLVVVETVVVPLNTTSVVEVTVIDASNIWMEGNRMIDVLVGRTGQYRTGVSVTECDYDFML